MDEYKTLWHIKHHYHHKRIILNKNLETLKDLHLLLRQHPLNSLSYSRHMSFYSQDCWSGMRFSFTMCTTVASYSKTQSSLTSPLTYKFSLSFIQLLPAHFFLHWWCFHDNTIKAVNKACYWLVRKVWEKIYMPMIWNECLTKLKTPLQLLTPILNYKEQHMNSHHWHWTNKSYTHTKHQINVNKCASILYF